MIESSGDRWRPRGDARFRQRAVQGLPAILLAVNASLLAWGAHVHSPTYNEPGHLAAGISNWQFGRFDVYKVNPPLVRMVAAMPVLLAGAKTDWHGFCEGIATRPEFPLGEDFVAANRERSAWLFTLARWACIPFSVLGGYLSFRWARELYGRNGGLLALTLWCFCPNMIAHGQLITADAAATALGLAACYTFWHWLQRPTWRRAFLSGAVLGVAELTKTTLVIFYPLWPVMWLIYRWPERRGMHARDWLRQLGMLVTRVVVGLYVINLGYGFEGSGMRLDKFQFVSATLGSPAAVENGPASPGNRFAGSWIGSLPIPLPTNYLTGIDLQRRDFENYRQPSYLRGAFHSQGWWYYYLYALAIKVPLGTWLLLLLASGCRSLVGRKTLVHTKCDSAADCQVCDAGSQPTTLRDEFVLLCPAVVILAFVSSQTGFSEHMRYVLPAFPFCFIWIGRIGPFIGRHHRALTGLATAALGWAIGSSLAVYPHSLSYFNELVGGPTDGPKHLIHSNVDWGQDLLFLKQWIDEHPEATPLKLAYFGYCDPKYFGIEYSAPESAAVDRNAGAAIAPGWYAISVNFVRGMPHFSYKGDGKKTSYAQHAFVAFQKIVPTAMAGYSIYIYHVE